MLKYYIPPLLTFIKGDETYNLIYGLSDRGDLPICSCRACSALPVYSKEGPLKGLLVIPQDHQEFSYQHFVHTLLEQRKSLGQQSVTTSKELLELANKIRLSIQSSSNRVVGEKVLPNYESILRVLNN